MHGKMDNDETIGFGGQARREREVGVEIENFATSSTRVREARAGARVSSESREY